MKGQYQEFLRVIEARRTEFDKGKFCIFKTTASFGYKEQGTFGVSWASWIPAESEGDILIDRLSFKTKEYKTFSGWLKAVERKLH